MIRSLSDSTESHTKALPMDGGHVGLTAPPGQRGSHSRACLDLPHAQDGSAAKPVSRRPCLVWAMLIPCSVLTMLQVSWRQDSGGHWRGHSTCMSRFPHQGY